MNEDFEIIGGIEDIEIIAVGRAIREIRRLRKVFGRGRWRKLKGKATVRLEDGTIHCSSTLVETMHFSARLSVATHLGRVIEVVPDAGRPTQRSHNNAAYSPLGVGDKVPLPS